jgi:hypothetical protein
VQASFGDLMSGLQSPADLADFLDAALPLSTVDSALLQLQLAINLRLGMQSLGLPVTIAALEAAESDLGASQAQLASALSAADAYLASYYPAGGSPPSAWSALVAGLQAAGNAAGAAVDSIPSLATLAIQVHRLPASLASPNHKDEGLLSLLCFLQKLSCMLTTCCCLLHLYPPPCRLACSRGCCLPCTPPC